MLSQDAIGGTELMVVMLMKRLAAHGMDAELAVLKPPGPMSEELSRSGFRVFAPSTGGLATGARALSSLLRRRSYDLVNVYGFKASVIVRFVARALRADPLILVGVQGCHVTEAKGTDDAKARFAMFVERHSWPMLSAYEANSRGALELLASHGIPHERLNYIPNGVDLAAWPPRATPDRVGIPTILCTARFIPRKRQEDLLRAVCLLRRRGTICRLLLVGDGPQHAAMRKLAGELDIADITDFPGALSGVEINDCLEEAAVFCLPSLSEGMPAALMEAMARAVPVVATKVNGISDLIEDGRTGRLVPPRSPHALAGALQELLENRDLANRLAYAGRKALEADHSLDQLVLAKVNLYQEMVEAAHAN